MQRSGQAHWNRIVEDWKKTRGWFCVQFLCPLSLVLGWQDWNSMWNFYCAQFLTRCAFWYAFFLLTTVIKRDYLRLPVSLNQNGHSSDLSHQRGIFFYSLDVFFFLYHSVWTLETVCVWKLYKYSFWNTHFSLSDINNHAMVKVPKITFPPILNWTEAFDLYLHDGMHCIASHDWLIR